MIIVFLSHHLDIFIIKCVTLSALYIFNKFIYIQTYIFLCVCVVLLRIIIFHMLQGIFITQIEAVYSDCL